MSWRRFLEESVGIQPRAPRSKRKRNRQEIIARILERAESAEAEGNAEALRRCSYKLLRYECYDRAWYLYSRAVELEKPSPISTWDGRDLAGQAIVVWGYAPWYSIGEELRLARFIAPAARRARRCIVLSEPRLVPLLRRTFPAADVRPRGADDAAAFAEADVAAYYETIAFHCAKTADELRHSFIPLQADPKLVSSIRQRYRETSRGPLIGLSWWSSNAAKSLPSLESWAPLLEWDSPTFVSLQYGDVTHDLEVLEKLTGGHMIYDSEIDQLVDLDSFAAQIAALDAVVSINNTTVDMAGMLGAPILHVLDDKSFSIWPESGTSPWYPEMKFLHRRQRPWTEVFVEARASVEQHMAAGPT